MTNDCFRPKADMRVPSELDQRRAKLVNRAENVAWLLSGALVVLSFLIFFGIFTDNDDVSVASIFGMVAGYIAILCLLIYQPIRWLATKVGVSAFPACALAMGVALGTLMTIAWIFVIGAEDPWRVEFALLAWLLAGLTTSAVIFARRRKWRLWQEPR